MVHSLLHPRATGFVVSATIAALAWATTDLATANRALTTLLAFAAAYLSFNAGAAYFERDA